jgi:hypothetical protein
MMMILDRSVSQPGFIRAVSWRGRSGQFYALTCERLEDFSLSTAALSVITSGSIVLWVGSATDVINDAMSRARFRLALDCADRVFSLPAPGDEVQRMTMIWDLEGAEPVSGRAAA